MPTLLHIGCGQARKDRTTRAFATPQWREVRLDIDPSVGPDIVASMTGMPMVACASMDAVFSSHNVEHLYPFEVAAALKEFRRVLKPDGFAIVTCPDLQSVAALVAEDKLMEPVYQSPSGPVSPIDILYGHRPSLARGHLFMAHRCGFTARSLSEALCAAGFANVIVRRRPAFFDLWTAATAEPAETERLRALAAEHFPEDAAARTVS